jgi:hypothetical protein
MVMNEQLKQLATQAQLEHCVSHVRLEDFAMLVVAKCIQAVETTDTRALMYTSYDEQLVTSTISKAKNSIKQLFKS